MNSTIQNSKLDLNILEEYRNENYLSVLAKVRSKANIYRISDLATDHNREVVKKALRVLEPKAFTAQQWRVAAYFLTGKRIDISSSEQLKNTILLELSE
ncbi:MAG: hypothetical protein ABFD11_13605 [Christensenella sp.]